MINHLFQSSVFIKVAWKRDFSTAGFLWILQKFLEQFFIEHLQVTAYVGPGIRL